METLGWVGTGEEVALHLISEESEKSGRSHIIRQFVAYFGGIIGKTKAKLHSGLVMTASFTTHLGVLYKLAACVSDRLIQAGMLRRQITPTGLVLFDN